MAGEQRCVDFLKANIERIKAGIRLQRTDLFLSADRYYPCRKNRLMDVYDTLFVFDEKISLDQLHDALRTLPATCRQIALDLWFCAITRCAILIVSPEFLTPDERSALHPEPITGSRFEERMKDAIVEVMLFEQPS